MFNFLTQNRELKEQNRALKIDLEWNKFLRREADGLNSILKKVLVKKNNKIAELEKRVADLEERLTKTMFVIDDKGTPIKSFTLTGKLTMLKEPAEEKLEVGKWYHTTDFTKEELEELLPVGTKVEVEKDVSYEDMSTKEPENTVVGEVKKLVYGNVESRLLIDIDSWFNREWFKIIEE